MRGNSGDRVRKLLKQALPPTGVDSGPARDLWPAVLRRLDEERTGEMQMSLSRPQWSWFDGALIAGVALLVAAFPASISMLLYCL